MDGPEMILLQLITMIVPILSSDYCPAVKYFNLQLPRTTHGLNVTKDCSAINSSWTGKLTARCTKNPGGTILWQYRQGCGCELKTVLQYYETQVSRVSMANFLEVAHELEKAYTNFTNQKIYHDLLTTLKKSTCKKTPSIKSPEWDEIYTYCEKTSNNLEKQIHFKNYFCQKRSTNDDTVLVLTSFTRSSPGPNGGEAIVDLGESSSWENVSQIVSNILASVNSSGCTVTSYYVTNGTITIRAKADSTRMETQNKTREVLELVLISVSLVGITCSLILLSCIRKQSSQTYEKLFIHKNLLLSWGIGYAVYIVDITSFDSRNLRSATCTAVVVIRHFFQTAVFTWMLVEAVNLFIKLVKVISTKTFYITYLAIGWGIPVLIVGITAAARTETYDMSQAIIKEFMCGSIKFTATIERTSCWLNGSKWLYTGPVCAILLVNLVIFVMLLKVVLGKVAIKYNNDQIMKTRKGLKSVATLLPLLGVTWLFGLFVELHEVLAYIFILLTSTQGIIFCIFHCILDDQVRKTLSGKFKTSHIRRNIALGGESKKYTVNRTPGTPGTPGMELAMERTPKETIETFKEITDC